MKCAVLVTVFAMAIGTVARAQSPAPGDHQSMPQGTNSSTQPQTSSAQMTDTSGQGTTNSERESKGEKKLKGCIQSEGGGFALLDKHGKSTPLAGLQDVASHVGHTVTLHGSYARGSEAAASGGASGEQFMVSKIDMNAETCKYSKASDKDKGHDKSNSKPSPYRQ